MKKILIFDDIVFGHHLEYLHHLYLRAIECSNAEFIFAVPQFIQENGKQLSWPRVSHVSFRYISKDELGDYNNKSQLAVAWHFSFLIRKIMKETKVNEVFFIYPIRYMPFLPFLIPFQKKISGIIYKIYLYTWKTSSLWRKLLDLFLNALYVYMPCFKTLFILNDMASSRYLGHLWNTNRFTYLVDPYSGNIQKLCNSKKRYSKLTFLHFGCLAKRKGTITILKALKLLSSEEQKNIHMIIAGCIKDEIRTEFNQLVEDLSANIDFEIYDEFVSYQTIEEFCSIADYLLIPYTETAQSSGVITFAAKYMVPVIGPKTGLLGKIIKKYQLGIVLDSIDCEALCLTFQKCLNEPTYRLKTDYLSVITIDCFQNQIFTKLLS